jgi:hypothetical protein
LDQGYEFGFAQELQRLLREMRGDAGYQAFIDQTNREFRAWIVTLLGMGKFSDPLNEAEARAIVADPSYFDCAQELVSVANGGPARLRGQGDVLQGFVYHTLPRLRGQMVVVRGRLTHGSPPSPKTMAPLQTIEKFIPYCRPTCRKSSRCRSAFRRRERWG